MNPNEVQGSTLSTENLYAMACSQAQQIVAERNRAGIYDGDGLRIVEQADRDLEKLSKECFDVLSRTLKVVR